MAANSPTHSVSKSHRGAALVILLLLGALAPALRSQVTRQQPSNAAPGSDPYHPRQFMRIIEIDEDGDRRVLFGGGGTTKGGAREPTGRLHREIDQRSSIRIEFDKDRIQDLDGLEVQIVGSVKGDKETRRIEIPGYSVVGEQTTTAGLALVGTRRFGALKETVSLRTVLLTKAFDDAFKRLQQADSAAIGTASRELASAQSALNGAVKDSIVAMADIVRTRAASSDSAGHLIITASDSGALAQRRQVIADARARAKTSEAQLKAIYDKQNSSVAVRVLVDTLTRVFQSEVQLRDVLGQLGEATSRPISQVVNYSGVALPIVWTGTLHRLAESYARIAKERTDATPAAMMSLRDLLFEMREDIQAINGILIHLGNDQLDRAVKASLRETGLTVSSAGAHVGESITITLRSFVDGGDKREVTIDLGVAEHGIVRRVEDSFFFLKRSNMSDVNDTSRVLQRAAQYKSASPLARQVISTTVDVPLDENYTATPGVSFGWVYLPRDGVNWGADALRSLKLGWGVNASFPSFSTKHIRITPPATDDGQAKIEGQTVEKQSFGISVGPYLSVFDGAIGVSYGWNMTVNEKRQYFAAGLSFIGLAKQGRDLLDKLQKK